jgi:hypothetical protein
MEMPTRHSFSNFIELSLGRKGKEPIFAAFERGPFVVKEGTTPEVQYKAPEKED